MRTNAAAISRAMGLIDSTMAARLSAVFWRRESKFYCTHISTTRSCTRRHNIGGTMRRVGIALCYIAAVYEMGVGQND